MTSPPYPKEEQRIQQLRELDLLDTVSEQSYDDLVSLASAICDTPIALISLVDDDRQWFKAKVGLNASETPRDIAFCSHALLEEDILLVPDPHKDARFANNPLVKGEPHIGFYAGVPLFNEELPMGTLCVIDHTPRALNEDQLSALRRLGRQVEKLFSLRKQVIALRQTQHQQDEFISMINHELRTPLTSIIGTVSLLYSNQVVPLPKEATELLAIAQRNCHRLLNIVNDVLDISSLGAGTFKHSPQPFDLLASCRQSIQMLQTEATKKQQEITLHTTLGEAQVIADPHRISQVLQNLLSNAVKYSFEDTEITLTLSKGEEGFTTTITNAGPGIPQEDQAHLFQRFFRSRVSHKGNPEGTGLGLYICKQILQLSGGEIGCHSELNETTSFWFTLPEPNELA